MSRNREQAEGPLADFIEQLRARVFPVVRVPGCAVFLNASAHTTPLALRHNVEHNHVLHEHVVIVTVTTEKVPHVPQADRVTVDELGHSDDGIVLVPTRFGFQDEIDVPSALKLAFEVTGEGHSIGIDDASYFLSRITITPTSAAGMASWRKRLFVTLSRNAASPAEYFGLPEDRVVALGSRVDLSSPGFSVQTVQTGSAAERCASVPPFVRAKRLSAHLLTKAACRRVSATCTSRSL